MSLRQFAGKFRRIRLAETVQKAGDPSLFFGGKLGQLRLDFLHAHDPESSERAECVNGGFA